MVFDTTLKCFLISAREVQSGQFSESTSYPKMVGHGVHEVYIRSAAAALERRSCQWWQRKTPRGSAHRHQSPDFSPPSASSLWRARSSASWTLVHDDHIGRCLNKKQTFKECKCLFLKLVSSLRIFWHLEFSLLFLNFDVSWIRIITVHRYNTMSY